MLCNQWFILNSVLIKKNAMSLHFLSASEKINHIKALKKLSSAHLLFFFFLSFVNTWKNRNHGNDRHDGHEKIEKQTSYRPAVIYTACLTRDSENSSIWGIMLGIHRCASHFLNHFKISRQQIHNSFSSNPIHLREGNLGD